MTAAAGVWLPLVAPLIGAALLALPHTAHAGRRWWDPITLATLGLAVVGFGCAVAAWPVLGQAARYPISLGPLDPSEPVAGAAWSLAPAAIGVVFLAVAMGTKSRLVIRLALVQLAIAIVATAWELVQGAPDEGASAALAVDTLAITLLGVSVIVGGLITVYALGYEPAHLEHRALDPRRTARFLAWLLVFVSAMNLLVLADDLRLFVIGWEGTTLCSFMLIGFEGDRPALTAARRALAYNLLGGIALGVAVLLVGPGGRLSDIVDRDVAAPWALPLVLVGCIGAAATKSALVPFHPWLLGAMVAAAPVSALLHASAMVKAGSYLLLRLAPAISVDGILGPALAVLGAFTFAATAICALRERDLKRILAWSTISTLGLIAAAAGLGSPAALAAGVMLLVFHAVAKALAFLSVGAIEQVTRTRDVEVLVGSLRTVPRLAGPLAIAAAALALPPFGLAVAKWAILEIGAREVPLMVLLAIGGAAYLAVWTAVIGRLIVRRAGIATTPAGEALPRREGVPIAVLSLASISGLLLAAPIARELADPAGLAAFGVDPGLATGWSIVLDGGLFAVPVVAALGLTAAALAIAVGRRIRTVAPAPYLSGATLAHGPAGAFHGGLGGPIVARSGGFYWGGGVAPDSGAVPDGAAPDGGNGGERNGSPASRPLDGLGLAIIAVGWFLVAALLAAAVLSTAGLRLG
jgi:ech hydrogenase subunit A